MRAAVADGEQGRCAIRNRLGERLEQGVVLCAEGYVFELERRGYVQAGPFVPEVVLEHPEVVKQVHEDFVRAGSDVVEALTYYAHREKLSNVGAPERVEELNRTALRIAAGVAREHDALLAGNISNTNVYDPDDAKVQRAIRGMFDEQVGWAKEAGVDYVIAETLSYYGEAELALAAIRAADLPAVVTFAVPESGRSLEGLEIETCCARLAEQGAQVVGLNCFRGPDTTLPLVERVRARVDCEVAALPVPYRTTEADPTFLTLKDPHGLAPSAQRAFPTALEPFMCNRYEVAEMTKRAQAMGVRYLGLCCGASPHHVRAMAEALGRTPPSSRYSPDLEASTLFRGGLA